MKLKIMYFASIREAVGRNAEDLDVPDGVRTVGALRDWLIARGEPYAGSLAAGRTVRASVDRSLAESGAPLREGAEVAFFPPVTGG